MTHFSQESWSLPLIVYLLYERKYGIMIPNRRFFRQINVKTNSVKICTSISQFFSKTLWYFRQINYLVLSLIETVLSRNFCQKTVQTRTPQLRLAKKYAMNEKSTIFVQFCSNFERLTNPLDDQSMKVWAKSDKNCGFFINGIFLDKSQMGWTGL